MVSCSDKKLNVIISCDHLPGHSWMSFLCWHSLSKNLPEVNVSVVCVRENVSGGLFLWTKKLGVPFKMFNRSNLESVLGSCPRPNLVVPPYCVAVRDFEESCCDYSFIQGDTSLFIEQTNLICEAKEDGYCPFYSFKNGWGNFIMNDWVNKSECPLSRLFLSKFSKLGMSSNEKKVENLWNESLNLFQSVSGGSFYEEI